MISSSTSELEKNHRSPILSIRDLQVPRGRFFSLTIHELDIFEGEALAIMGPNGAGKSTLLLALARLISPAKGEIRINGHSIYELDELEYRRKLALVLQEPLLFNTTVFNNVATGLRFRRLTGREIERRVDDWLSRLGIANLRDRPASSLSGGQAQRTSLARALILHPDLLLLDEPFSALDSPTRKALMQDLRSLLRDSGITSIFITHDQDEALFFGDRVAVLLDGNLRQVGEPQQIFSNPNDPTIAEFVGVENVFPGKVDQKQDGRVSVKVGDHRFEAIGDYGVAQEVLFCLRPEDITLWPAADPPLSSARNRVSGRVRDIYAHGPLVHLTIDCGIPVIALITRASADDLNINEDQEIIVAFKASAVHLIPK